MTQGMVWKTPSGPSVVAPVAGRLSISWLLRTSLCFSFLTAFLQYLIPAGIVQFASLAIFAFCGLLVLCGPQRAQRVQHVFSGGGVVFAAVLFGEAISYTSRDTYSVLYGLMFLGVFLCGRLIVQEIGVPNVMRAYSQAGILTVCVILVAGRQTLLATESRFSGGTRAHPNLVGFVLAGFLPAIVWRAMEEKLRWRKRTLIAFSLVTFSFIFATGSRGSLFAVLIAGLALLVRGITGGWLRRFRIRHLHFILLILLIPLAIGFLLQHNRIGHIGDFLDDFLSLSTRQRGIKSGLSGRTGIWEKAFRILRTRDRWLFGFGYRAGDRLVGTIDNGYVQLLFESGLIAGSMIFGSMLRAFFLLWKASRPRENNAWTRYYMMLWCLMVVYFLNNISTRYLFSLGSPFSLCILCLTVASRRELLSGGLPARVTRKVKPPPRAAAEALTWNHSRR
jgi:O-antigen ligase